MKKFKGFIAALLIGCLIAPTAGADAYSNLKIRIREVDGTPSVYPIRQITVSNGTLTDDTGGNVTLAIPSVAGSDTQIMFNLAGVFGGEAAFTYDYTTNTFIADIVQAGQDGTDGSIIIFADQATDRTVTINPHAAMTQDVTYTLPADDGAASQFLQTDGSGALVWATVAASTAYDDIGNPDANSSIDFTTFENAWTNDIDTGIAFTMTNTLANPTAVTLLQLEFNSSSDNGGTFIKMVDDADGTPRTVFSIGEDGNINQQTITGGNVLIGTTIKASTSSLSAALALANTGGTGVLTLRARTAWDQFEIILNDVGSGTGNNFVISDFDTAGDMGHAVSIDPTVWIHSGAGTGDTAEYFSLAHNQTDAIATSGQGDIVLAPFSNDVEIGIGAAGIDYTLTFDGETADGVITWMEDEDFFRFEDDLLFNTGAGLPYGDINAVDNAAETAIATQGVAVQVLIFDTNGPSNLTTGDFTTGDITISESGDYFVSVSATVNSVSGAASRFQMTVEKNNGAVLLPGLHVDRNITGGGGESASVGMSGIVTLTAADTIEVWIENETNTQNYIVEDINLSLIMIGK